MLRSAVWDVDVDGCRERKKRAVEEGNRFCAGWHEREEVTGAGRCRNSEYMYIGKYRTYSSVKGKARLSRLIPSGFRHQTLLI